MRITTLPLYTSKSSTKRSGSTSMIVKSSFLRSARSAGCSDSRSVSRCTYRTLSRPASVGACVAVSFRMRSGANGDGAFVGAGVVGAADGTIVGTPGLADGAADGAGDGTNDGCHVGAYFWKLFGACVQAMVRLSGPGL